MEITLENVVKIIEELLKYGQHEGACDNEGYEDECACEKHLEASDKREEKARAFIAEYDSYLFDKCG